MDPITNPYTPGAGTPPPELAGRDQLREQVRIAVARIRLGYSAKSVILVGLRGVGKTVLLRKMQQDAADSGLRTIQIEVPEDRSLPALLAPKLRQVLLQLNKIDKAKDAAQRALRAVTGFAKGLKVKYGDIEVGFDLEPEPGLADNGDLEGDLATLLEQVGSAAQSAETAVVLFVDELQYLKEDQFAALISALHRCAQSSLPVAMVGAGLPQLPGRAGNAKSYSERLFDFPIVGALNREEAKKAIVKPAESKGVRFTDESIEKIFSKTKGYPYFLQEWAKHSWDVARQSPITLADVEEATDLVICALDENFFRVRLDRLTPKEKEYLRAMAELGPGRHRSGEIAEILGKTVNSFGILRSKLIAKGMIWSPNHGDNEFTVPLFDEFMKRAMPKIN